MIPGSTDIVVDVPPVQSSYAAQMPDWQLGVGTSAVLKSMEASLFLQQTQHNILHQLLGVGTCVRGDLRKLCLLLRGEMYFHRLQGTKKPRLWQVAGWVVSVAHDMSG